MIRASLLGLVIVITTTACSSDVAEREVRELASQVAALQDSVRSLRGTIELNELLSKNDVAYFTPGADGYAVINFDLGSLTMSLEDVRPYANGTKVSLRVGNITSATVNGLNATLEWGQVDSLGRPQNEKARSKKLTLEQSLRPGAWTTVTAVLPDVPASDFGFLRVRDVGHQGIRLYR